MESLAYVTLDMQNPALAVVVYAKQNDRMSRKIVAQLVDGSATWTVPAGAYSAIRYMKPDGLAGFYDVDEGGNSAVVVSGSIITMTLAEQALTVPGDVLMELNFYDGDGAKLTTFTWTLRVQESVLPDTTIVSSGYYNVLTTQIATAVDAAETAVSLIGAAQGAVRFDTAQTLTSAQQAQARSNVGAINAAGAPVQSVDGRTGAVSTVPFHIEFNTTQSIKTQIDALASHPGCYSFYINYGNVDMPTTSNAYAGFVQFADPDWISVVAFPTGSNANIYRLYKRNGEWAEDWTTMAIAT